MPQDVAGRGAADEPRLRTALPFVIAVGVVVVGLIVVVLVSVLGSDGATRQQVAVRFGSRATAQSWTVPTAGVLISTRSRTTLLDLQIRRDTTDAADPLLRATFTSGSGASVACVAPASTRWQVDVGETQEFQLPCDRFVAGRDLSRVGAVGTDLQQG